MIGVGSFGRVVVQPGFVAGLARLRQREKLPYLCSGDGIEGAHATRGTVGTHHQEVSIQKGRPLVGDSHGLFTSIAKSNGKLSSPGPQTDQLLIGSKKDSSWTLAIARPVGQAASGRWVITVQLVTPDLLPGLGFQGHHTIGGRYVHHAIDHQWCGFGTTGQGAGRGIFTQPVGPDQLQVSHVGGVDLVQGRIAGTGKVAVEHGPFPGTGLGLRDGTRKAHKHGQSKPRHLT